jgi:hypothetical protein
MTIQYSDVIRHEDTSSNLVAGTRAGQTTYESNGDMRQLHMTLGGSPNYWTPDDKFTASIPSYTNITYPAVSNVAEALDSIISDTTASVGPGTLNTLAMFTPDTVSIGDSHAVEDANGIMFSRTGANSWTTVKTTDTSGLTLTRTQAPGAELMLQVFGSTWPTSGGGVDGSTAAGGVILDSVGTFLAINQQSPDTTMHLTYRHTTKLAIDSTGTCVDKLKGFSTPYIHVLDTLRGDQVDLVHGMTGVLPANVYFEVAPQRGWTGYATIGVGAPLIKGIGTPDGCGQFFPGLTLEGYITETDPYDSDPAIKIMGAKSDGGTAYAALAPAETVLSIFNATVPVVNILGSGAIEGSGYIRLGNEVPGTPALLNGCCIYFDGTNVMAKRQIDGQTSVLSVAWV